MNAEQLAAWQRGIEKAEADLALRPPDDGTISVCLDRGAGVDQDRPYFKLCLACHNERGSARCPHDEGPGGGSGTSPAYGLTTGS